MIEKTVQWVFWYLAADGDAIRDRERGGQLGIELWGALLQRPALRCHRAPFAVSSGADGSPYCVLSVNVVGQTCLSRDVTYL